MRMAPQHEFTEESTKDEGRERDRRDEEKGGENGWTLEETREKGKEGKNTQKKMGNEVIINFLFSLVLLFLAVGSKGCRMYTPYRGVPVAPLVY